MKVARPGLKNTLYACVEIMALSWQWVKGLISGSKSLGMVVCQDSYQRFTFDDGCHDQYHHYQITIRSLSDHYQITIIAIIMIIIIIINYCCCCCFHLYDYHNRSCRSKPFRTHPWPVGSLPSQHHHGVSEAFHIQDQLRGWILTAKLLRTH